MLSLLSRVIPFLYLTSVLALPQQIALSNLATVPNIENARANAPKIFNAIHSSMRQWGSSLQHNGMSLFPATIPANTQLYHGTYMEEPVEGLEWLAFEIEHAEAFSRGPGGPPPGGPPGERPPGGGPPGGGPPGGGPPGGGKPPGERPERPGEPGPPPTENTESWEEQEMLNRIALLEEPIMSKGYLHEYRTRQALNCLYIDGMSAGKTNIGTLDTQDLILLNRTTGGVRQDWERAKGLCDLGSEWGIDGFIRMEAGFELILCNFTRDVELLSATQRSTPDDRKYSTFNVFEYWRGVSMRFQGITAGRVKLDYSNMVSAFWYDVNITNPEKERAELPRLTSDDAEKLAVIKADLKESIERESGEGIDWQGVADMITTRYMDRLQFMALNGTTRDALSFELSFLLAAFMDAKLNDTSEAIEHCSNHYFQLITPQTTSDHLIQAAFSAVTHEICQTLFEVCGDIDDEENTMEKLQMKIRSLIVYLNWTAWKACGKCSYDEVCFVAIWPWGSVEDHNNPGCIKSTDVGNRSGYWGRWGPPPPKEERFEL